MKKIILLLNLIAFTAISQVTPVGGYLPLNSSKSFTAGNATCSNVIARGTFSVGSTATITGGIITPTINVTSGSSFYLGSKTGVARIDNSSGTFRFLNSGDAFSSTQTGALTVSGNLITTGTHSLGSANLTGGNTGTVAVLSDAVFNITFNSPSTNPADGVTYYFSNLNFPAQQTSTGGTVTIPYNCTLIGWDFNMSITGTVGSGETATLVAMANNATVSVLSTAITFSNVTGYNGFSATGLSTNFTAGDKFNLRMISPTWATNPTQIYTGVTFWFVRRS